MVQPQAASLVRGRGSLRAGDLSAAADIDSDAAPVIIELPQPPHSSEVSEFPPDRTDKWAIQARERYAAVYTLLGNCAGASAPSVSSSV